METPNMYPKSKYPAMVGEYPVLANTGAGYVWDEVLEYRVWCHEDDGDDYYYAFEDAETALECSREEATAEAPLALILQKEYISESEEGQYIHMNEERITEWPIEFLSRPRRTERTIPDFMSPDAPENKLDIIRGLVNKNA
jgi:hypothetical protein